MSGHAVLGLTVRHHNKPQDVKLVKKVNSFRWSLPLESDVNTVFLFSFFQFFFSFTIYSRVKKGPCLGSPVRRCAIYFPLLLPWRYLHSSPPGESDRSCCSYKYIQLSNVKKETVFFFYFIFLICWWWWKVSVVVVGINFVWWGELVGAKVAFIFSNFVPPLLNKEIWKHPDSCAFQ